jgi:pimeloyl-ACP methyl ester carboxylesterase
MAIKDLRIEVDSLQTRYLEAGSGPAVLLLHGASPGSSADVWERNLEPLAAAGLRAIALDQPGFGLTDNPSDFSVAYRQQFILRFLDVLGLPQASIVGHSQAGGMALSLACAHPERITRVVVLAPSGLLPPPPGTPDREGRVGPPNRPWETGKPQTAHEMCLLLEDQLFDHSLITDEVLERRVQMAAGKNFLASQERNKLPMSAPSPDGPLWQRLDRLPVPILMLYGANEGNGAADRVKLAKERYPTLNLHLLDRCGHFVQWDQPQQFTDLTARFVQPQLA